MVQLNPRESGELIAAQALHIQVKNPIDLKKMYFCENNRLGTVH
jgi:hypothetical protein